MTELHDLSGGGDVLDRVTRLAQRALAAYGCHPAAEVRLLNVSENATYLVEDPDAGRSVLRVHRLGYHSDAEIVSELTWMDALRAEAGVRTPRVMAATDGRRVVTATDEAGGQQRSVVRFEFLPGTEPVDDSVEHFAELGEITARMHRHARQWARPADFTRFVWGYDEAFGSVARWGRWQDGIGVGTEEREVLGRLDAALHTRLANLLVDDGGRVSVIDFDDSGFGWYLYDVGTSVSFFEHEPQVPGLIDAWLTGYRREAELSAADEAEIWTFILFRRLLLVAWIGSHRAVDIAQQLGAGYTRDSCDLAEAYLSRAG